MFICLLIGLAASLFVWSARAVNVDERYNDPGLATYVTVYDFVFGPHVARSSTNLLSPASRFETAQMEPDSPPPEARVPRVLVRGAL